MKTLLEQFRAARRSAVPLVAITTPDPGATVDLLATAYPNDVDAVDGEGAPIKLPIPKVQWDAVRGLTSLNDAGKQAIANVTGEYDSTIGNPVDLFRVAARLPAKTFLFVHAANRWLAEPVVAQGAWNLRDAFKGDRRTCVLLGQSMDLPPELAGDVVVLDEPLPDEAALDGIVRQQHANAALEVEGTTVAKAVEALQGLPAFQAEQVTAMALTADGLDVPDLWDRKRRQIELTPGLKCQRDGVRFADVGGVEVVKDFLGRILRGHSKPSAVVFVDEIEKFIAASAGGAGDSSGVSQDQLGTLLAYMQDQGAVGAIFVGPPGSAKSMIAKAAGEEGGIPTIQLDLGGLKGSLVGQSEQQLRAALKVVTSVSNGRSLWIATCNSIADLPPELRRRFTLGTFFFDLPTKAERRAIWGLYLAKYGHPADPETAAAAAGDDGWTGAEIRQCCELAWRLGCTVFEAAKFVVPVSRSAAEQLERLRKAAEGRFLSASRPGVYSREPAAAPTTNGRRQRATAHTEE